MLCEIAHRYKTDKCPQVYHDYTPFYFDLFEKRRMGIKKVLEVGIGGSRMLRVVPGYVLGASLKMWRDFFPNAQVFGADIARSSLFEDERIKTFYCDERKKNDLLELIKQTGTDIDLFIDDASHLARNQFFLFKTVFPILDKGVVYIIEDVKNVAKFSKLLTEYKYFVPELANPRYNSIIVIEK